MKKAIYKSILVLLTFNWNVSAAADNVVNPYKATSSDGIEVMMLDTNLNFIGPTIDREFILRNHTLFYKNETSAVVSSFVAALGGGTSGGKVTLPEWYRFVPQALLIFPKSTQYLYDGCYVQSLSDNSYYVVSENLSDLLDKLSFSTHEDCQRPSGGG